MNTSQNVAFIGLGVMGGPMAAHLARAGHKVTVWNRSPERAAKWRDAWAQEGLALAFADTPKNAAEEAEIVFICVGNDKDLEEAAVGEGGFLAGLS